MRGWLDGRSEFFTTISGFTVTRRQAVAVNALFMALAVAAVTAEGAWPLAVAALGTGVYLVRWLKAEDLKQKGGER